MPKKNSFPLIEKAFDDLRKGKFLILVDDESREGEGDLIIAAEHITPTAINFMMREACGLICLPMTGEMIDRLQIPLMPERDKISHQALFTVSIEAKRGVRSGTSAADRAHTILTAVQGNAQDISMPGHVFPLRAAAGGVLMRAGHTEGSVDLVRLAGLKPASVICEIMNTDGSMASLADLEKFSKKHDIQLISVNDIIAYRLATEKVVEETASAYLPLDSYGSFQIKNFKNKFDGSEHIALISEKKGNIVRVHSECLTGDVFACARCDCGAQLHAALDLISREGGALLYMRQEGRGIGLGNKIKAYALQDQGLDTVEANHSLGFLADQRHYGMSAQMLQALQMHSIRLLTNNPRKIEGLSRFGIEVTERIPIEIPATSINSNYLKIKKNKLGHLLELNV